MKMRFRSLLVLAFCVMILPATALADAAGRIMFVHGSVDIVNKQGEKRQAKRGGEVFEGDKIISAKASSMQIKMVDGGFLAIRPVTTFRLDTYRYNKDGNDKVESSLLKGGLRSITGSIGKNRKESFKLKTPVATIGIRGTDFDAAYLPNGTQSASKGAYIRVYSGKGYMQTNAGVQFVNPDQTAHAENSSQLPSLLSQTPDFLIRFDESGAEESEEESDDRSEGGESSDSETTDTAGDDEENTDSNDSSEREDSRSADNDSSGGSSSENDASSSDDQASSSGQDSNDSRGNQVNTASTDQSNSQTTALGRDGQSSDDSGSNNLVPTDVPEDVSQTITVSNLNTVVDGGSFTGPTDTDNGIDQTQAGQVVEDVQDEVEEVTGGEDSVVTSNDEILSQQGEFSYQSVPESDTVFFAEGSRSTLDVDFDSGEVLYDVVLIVDPARTPSGASMDNGGEWHLQGKGTLEDLLSGGLTLTGYYLDYTDGSTHAASGLWRGVFTGEGAQGFSGSLSLNTNDNSLQLAGLGIVEGRQELEDYLAGSTEQTDIRLGYVLFKTGALSLGDFRRFNKDGQLKGLVDETGTELVADDNAGMENRVNAGDAEIVWGVWNSWRQVIGIDVTEDSFPIQYIHTTNLSEQEAITQRSGIFNYDLAGGSAVNSNGDLGQVTAGALAVDFDLAQVSMSLDASVAQTNWSVSGEGSVAGLQSGGLSLSGFRLNNTDQSQEDVTGLALGQFAGSNLDGVFGFFSLNSSSDQVNGTYAFNNPALNNYLQDATELTDIRRGYVLNRNELSSLDGFTRWQQDGELKALVNASNTQWVAAAPSQNEITTQVGDAEVVQGRWDNGWYEISDQSFSAFDQSVQYIHSDTLTGSGVVQALQGVYQFSSLAGLVVDNSGASGSLTGGSLSVDFSQQTLDLALQATVAGVNWSAIGAGDVVDLQTGELEISGNRDDGNAEEAITGRISGQFVSSQAEGVLGAFQFTSSNDRLEGTYLFSGRVLNDYLADATEQSDVRFGYVMRAGNVQDITAFTRWRQDNELKGLVNIEGTQWVAEIPSGHENSLQVADADITWGAWTNSWYEIVGDVATVLADSVQYIHTDQTTDASVVSSKKGLFTYGRIDGQVVDANGQLGSITGGDLTVDFSEQSLELSLQASTAAADWSAQGSDSIARLQTGGLSLSGERLADDISEPVSGELFGQFAGSDAEALFGNFSLTGSSDVLQGSYLFSDRSLNDYLADATESSDSRHGYLTREDGVSDLSLYTRWRQDGELKALVDASGRQWVARSPSGHEYSLQINDAEITWGSWLNGWYDISDDTLIEQDEVIHYIHSDLITSSGVMTALEGRYEFGRIEGQAINSSGTLGSIQGGSLLVDFSEQQLELGLQASAGGADWSVSGQDDFAALTRGHFSLSGQRSLNGQAENANGTLEGQFAGSDIDAVFGSFVLDSSSDHLVGSIVFSERSLTDYLIDFTLQTDSRFGAVLQDGDTLDITGFTRWYDNGQLHGLVNSEDRQWVAQENSVQETSIEADDANVVYGRWTNGWYDIVDDSLTVMSDAVQYIHTDLLTDQEVIASSQGQYLFNSVHGQIINAEGSVGSITEGALSIDFSSASVDLVLSAYSAGSDWNVAGQDSISELQAGRFALSGQRVEDSVSEVATGVIQGAFVGSDAGGVFGSFSLSSSSDRLIGTYVFNDRISGDYLFNATELTDSQSGSLLVNGVRYELGDFTRWEQDDELKAFVSAEDTQWVAKEASDLESNIQAGGSTITLGMWNKGWYEVVEDSAEEYDSLVQYVSTDILTSSSTLSALNGIYTYNTAQGNVVNNAGETGTVTAGHFAVDFSAATVEMNLEAIAGTSYWYGSGSGLISDLQSTGLSLVGFQMENSNNLLVNLNVSESSSSNYPGPDSHSAPLMNTLSAETINSAQGSVYADFAGSAADGVFGHFSLASSADSLNGVFAYTNPVSLLANATELSNALFGYAIKQGSVVDVSGFTLWQESGEVKAFENNGDFWFALNPSGNESTVTLNDTDIRWGTWTQGWQDGLTYQDQPLPYIFSNQITDSAIINAKTEINSYSLTGGHVVSTAGDFGTLTDGGFTIDFSTQNIELFLDAMVGGNEWYLDGSSTVSNLLTGTVALTGERVRSGVEDAATGLLGGQFAGSNADGVWGYFDFATLDETLNGTYVFGNPSAQASLDNATLLASAGSRKGFILTQNSVHNVVDFDLWQESNELKGLVSQGGTWIALEPSGHEGSTATYDSEVRWGGWTEGWQQDIAYQGAPLQYVYTDVVPNAGLFLEISGIHNFELAGGNVVNALGEYADITSGVLEIDFSNDAVELMMASSFGDYNWSISGSGTLTAFRAGTLGLSGEKAHISDSNDSELATGNIFTEFSGSDAEAVLGYFSLATLSNSDSLTGVYVYGASSSVPDRYVSDTSSQIGFLLKDSVAEPIEGYERYDWPSNNELGALQNTSSLLYANTESNKEITLQDITYLGSAVTYGIWTTGWHEDSIEQTKPLLYVYTDDVTPTATTSALFSTYSMNLSGGYATNNAGEYGVVHSGEMFIDFSSEAVELYLTTGVGDYDWNLGGLGTVSTLRDGSFALSGDRTHISNSADTEVASGSLLGEFAGSVFADAGVPGDGAVMGYFNASTNSDNLHGVYVYENPVNVLSLASQDSSTQYGYVIRDSLLVTDISQYNRWQQDGELKALEQNDIYWVAQEASGHQFSLQAGDADVYWGAWTKGWKESLNHQSHPLQYIYSNNITPAATLSGLTSPYSYSLVGGNVVNSSGEYSDALNGTANIDFSADTVDIFLDASIGDYLWYVSGQDSVAALQAGTLSLSGSRNHHSDEGDSESANGVILGEFVGSNADAVMGNFLLSSSSDSLAGVYVFGSPLSALANATVDSNGQSGYVIRDSLQITDIGLYNRWQEAGELKALEQNSNYWIANSASGNHTYVLAGDADIHWGAWTNGWRDDSEYQNHPLQYLYTNSITPAGTVSLLTGIYSYNLAGGNVVNASGEYSNGVTGWINIDFSADNVELFLSASVTDYIWDMTGTGSVTILQTGAFGLSGTRTHSVDKNDSESSTGTLLGDFAGANAEALIGHFSLSSSSDALTGVYAFDSPMDALANATIDSSTQYGLVIKEGAGTNSDIALYDRYTDPANGNKLKALVYNTDYWIAEGVGEEFSIAANDATVVWGAWTNGWLEGLTFNEHPLQYIYTDVLTPAATVGAKTAIYNYSFGGGNVVNGTHEMGMLNDGGISVDFGSSELALYLDMSMGDYQWMVEGSGTIATFEAGLTLSGDRINMNDEQDQEVATGGISGAFIGSDADGVFGQFNLNSTSDNLTGVYVFNNPIDPMAAAVKDTAVYEGFVLTDDKFVGNIYDYALYNESGELKALESEGGIFIASSTSGFEFSTQQGSAEITWGAWVNGWQDSVYHQHHPLQYIYTDSQSTAAEITAQTNVLRYSFQGGNVVNSLGEHDVLTSAGIVIDFSASRVNQLFFEAGVGDYNWYAEGSGSITELQSGSLGLSGSREHKSISGDIEDATGSVAGILAGTSVDAVLGHFELISPSDSLTGVYVLGGNNVNVTENTNPSRISVFSDNGGVLLFGSNSEADLKLLDYADLTSANSKPYGIEDGRVSGYVDEYRFINADKTFQWSENDGRNDYGWSYTEGYYYDLDLAATSGTSTHRIFQTYINTEYVPDYATHAFVPQKLSYELKEGIMFSNNAGELIFNPVVTDNTAPGYGINTGLEVDLAEGFVSINLVVGTENQGLVAGEQTELWYMHAQQSTDFLYSLIDHVHADGANPSASAVILEGDLTGYNASGTSIDSASATGAWKLLWGGDEGQIMTGGLYFDAGSEHTEGVVAFQGDVLEYQRAQDVHGSHNANLSVGGLSIYQGLTEDSTPSAVQQAYYFDSNATINHDSSEFFIDNQGNNSVTAFVSDDGAGGRGDWVKIDDLSAQLTREQVTYTIDTSEEGPIDGTYTSGNGHNSIMDGSANSVGNVNWGRWSESAGGEGFEANVYGSDIQQLHYMYSDSLTPDATISAKGGMASYSFAGGSAPTRMDGSGNITIGSVNHANIDVNFDSDTLNVDISVLMGTDTIQGTALGAAINSLKSGISLGVTDSSDINFNGAGTLNGRFVGPDAEGIINVYQLQSAGGVGDVSGSAFLLRSKQVTPE